ncbi:MAG: chromosome segregation protein SMC [Clostridiales bacterium]|nr:chromosome segregation protein SMC [Clostridiales bacterium]
MYLKTLELHGFKSFPEKTVLHFNPGATVIVGPNGSGKSNITDAMRWVLGELSTKNIRGSKMEDVIFVGADGHRPMSFAEVSVTFDDSQAPRKLNCPHEEVTVTRRYYRGGESEYLINRQACRLKDIYELFMNTGIGREGYSIIGQGKIAEIISKRSEDRRGIFEESAGISKYRYKKTESQKKLSQTEDNMTRVLDIFSELEARVGPLERDAQKARKYLELYEEKKQLDVSLWLYDMEKLRGEADTLGIQCRQSAHELEMAQDTEAQLEAQYERMFDASQENKQVSGQLYDKIKGITEEIHQLEQSYQTLESDITHKSAMAQDADASRQKSLDAAAREEAYAEELRERLLKNGQEMDRLQEEVGCLDTKKKTCVEKKAALETSLAAALQEIQEKERVLSELRVRFSVLENSIHTQSDRQAQIGEETRRYQEKLSEIEKGLSDCRASVELYESALKKSDEEVARCDKELLALSDKAEIARKDLADQQADAQALSSRIAALMRMQEHFDGYNNSVRFVMKAHTEGKLKGIHGPISHLIRVQEEYRVALETALGANMQNIVVDDEVSAKSAIYALKNAGAGRATFYPLTSMQSGTRNRELLDAAGQKGFVGFADELLETKAQYKAVIASIIGRIAVFDNIENGTDVARRCGWKIRIVTLDGQQINMGGSLTGGSVRKDSGMLSRGAHIEKLKEQKAQSDKDAAAAQKLLQTLEGKITELQNYRRKEDEKAKLSEVMLRTERSQLDEYEANRGVIDNLLGQLAEDQKQLALVGEQGDADMQRLKELMQELEAEIGAIASKRAQIDIERNALDDSIRETDEKRGEAQISIAEHMRDAQNLQESIDASLIRAGEHHSAGDEYKNTAASLRDAALQAQKLTENRKQEAADLRATLSAAEQERVRLEAGNAEYDRRLNEIRLKTKDVAAKRELLFRAHTANETKLERLNDNVDKMTTRLWDEYELTHSTAMAMDIPAVTEQSRGTVAAKLTEMKNTIKGLGNVNVGAIDEYSALKERYDYLGEQLADLRASKEELEKIIESIDAEMERMFVAAFNQINQYFGETFRELFGGGSAHLVLTDPEHVLESGVEINAAPPGKMVKNLNLLSGGEQAFVAIALIFAMIRVNPSPFCIFDEIEAALDEVNVTRVANYVKRFSKELQIILISHRRGMMETADTLYGVTMPRRGVSKVFTLDVAAVARDKSVAEQFTQ